MKSIWFILPVFIAEIGQTKLKSLIHAFCEHEKDLYQAKLQSLATTSIQEILMQAMLQEEAGSKLSAYTMFLPSKPALI